MSPWGKLVVARVLDVTGDREQKCASVGLVTERFESVDAVVEDVGQVGEGFDVVDDGGLVVEPDRGREIGRLESRLAPQPFE